MPGCGIASPSMWAQPAPGNAENSTKSGRLRSLGQADVGTSEAVENVCGSARVARGTWDSGRFISGGTPGPGQSSRKTPFQATRALVFYLSFEAGERHEGRVQSVARSAGDTPRRNPFQAARPVAVAACCRRRLDVSPGLTDPHSARKRPIHARSGGLACSVRAEGWGVQSRGAPEQAHARLRRGARTLAGLRMHTAWLHANCVAE
jgi:hypothetical protein